MGVRGKGTEVTGGGLEGRKFRRMEKARSDEGGEGEQKNHSVSQFPLDNIHLFIGMSKHGHFCFFAN